jgi:hypothetical protein
MRQLVDIKDVQGMISGAKVGPAVKSGTSMTKAVAAQQHFNGWPRNFARIQI